MLNTNLPYDRGYFRMYQLTDLLLKKMRIAEILMLYASSSSTTLEVVLFSLGITKTLHHSGKEYHEGIEDGVTVFSYILSMSPDERWEVFGESDISSIFEVYELPEITKIVCEYVKEIEKLIADIL